MSNQSILESAAAAAAAATAALSDGTLKDCIPTSIETNAVAALAVTPAAVAVAKEATPATISSLSAPTDSSVPVPVPVPVLTKIIPAVPLPVEERDPNVPTERDAIVGSDLHSGTILLHDLVRLNFYFWKKLKEEEIADNEINPAAATKLEKEEEIQETQQECTASSTIAAVSSSSSSNRIEPPTDIKDVEELTSHLTQLFVNGRPYVLVLMSCNQSYKITIFFGFIHNNSLL